MYVNSYGVKQENRFKQAQSSIGKPKPEGHAFVTPKRLSHLGSSIKSANKMLIIALIAFTALTTAFAAAKFSKADAHVQGAVNTFGDAQYFGNPSINAGETAAAIDSVKKGQGYWTTTNTGRVAAFGDARSYGDLAGGKVKNIVSIVAKRNGNGYWLLGADGGVFTFGESHFYGSGVSFKTGNNTFVALVPSSSEDGYNLVDSSGAVYSFGDAQYYGGANGITSGDKIVDVAPTSSGNGYVMLASRGGVYAFGDAQFHGALSAAQLNKTAVSIAVANGGTGYWILGDDGGVFTFGNLTFMGSAVEPTKSQVPSTDLAVSNDGKGYWVINGTARTRVATSTTSSYGPEVWERLRNCESHGNYQINTGNGFYGAYQFSASTWRSMNTGYEYAHLAPPEVQDDAAMRLQQRGGWGQWPVCGKVATRGN